MITWAIDSGVGQAKLGAFEKQAASALAVALNRTMEQGHVALRRHAEANFTIREQRLLTFLAPIPLSNATRATREKLRVVSETSRSGRLFNPFERGEPKLQRGPDVPVAVPTSHLRFAETAVIQRRWFPHNLGLTPRRDPKTTETYYALGRGSKRKGLTPFRRTVGGKVQIKGKLRTFVLDPRFHAGLSPMQHGVYQRFGPDRRDIKMLWQYRRQVRRPPILRFEDTLTATFQANIEKNWQEALAFELATGRLSTRRTTNRPRP